jgi:hypothetical protein
MSLNDVQLLFADVAIIIATPVPVVGQGRWSQEGSHDHDR